MNRGRQSSFSSGGYTIVETLIFLAVSSIIFVSAVVLVGGRESRAEFQNGVRNFETKLADMANDVSTGYYRGTGASKECTGDDISGPQFVNPGSRTQGANINCVFVGTVVKLGDGGNRDRFTQFTMAGLRQSGGDNTTNLVDAKPKVLDNGVGFTQNDIGYGIRVSCVAVANLNGGACMPDQNAAIGFFTTFEGSDLTNASNGGAPQSNAISYGPQVTIGNSAAQAVTNINNFSGYGSASLNPQITICLVGGSNQHAMVQIGGGTSSGLTITSEIKEGTVCN